MLLVNLSTREETPVADQKLHAFLRVHPHHTITLSLVKSQGYNVVVTFEDLVEFKNGTNKFRIIADFDQYFRAIGF